MNESLHIGGVALKNRAVFAPMAGISDAAYRYIAWKAGAGLTVTEMASAKALIKGDRRTVSIIKTHPAARPYAVQLFGRSESDLERAALIARDEGADMIDLNLGCPVRKVLRSGAGGALLKDIPLVERIVRTLRRALNIPLTIKIRAGWDEKSPVAVDLARMAASEGVDAVTVHPRFVSEGFSGRARWDIIGDVASSVDIPVIGNGDVTCAKEALDMMRTTGCRAVMVGRAAMGNPFIFREIAAALAGEPIPAPPSSRERLETALEQFEIMLEYLPMRVAIFLWRKHLCWYARAMPRATEFRRVVFVIENPDKLREIAERFFLGGEIFSSELAAQPAGGRQ